MIGLHNYNVHYNTLINIKKSFVNCYVHKRILRQSKRLAPLFKVINVNAI